MNKIQAKIIADSIDTRGNRITSFILTYPRFIHSELMTHRMFSRNSASSRAIPFEKMVKIVKEDPFIPIAWQKDHKGMQGTEYIDAKKDNKCFPSGDWLEARDYAVDVAKEMNIDGVTKQLCNRLLEPFMWHTVLVTATEYDNFFNLRCPKYKTLGLASGPQRSKKDWVEKMKLSSAVHPDTYPKTTEEWLAIDESQAEIHIQTLAESMWDALHESTPNQLKPGEWHIPFSDKMDDEEILQLHIGIGGFPHEHDKAHEEIKIQIATARCARLSYMTFDGEIDYMKDIELHNRLLASHHMSPFEHCARAMSDLEYYSFIKGEYPTTEDAYGILNYEYYPLLKKEKLEEGVYGENVHNKDRYGWSNNFRGFIPYRYLIDREKWNNI